MTTAQSPDGTPSRSPRSGWGEREALLVVDLTRSLADATLPTHVPAGAAAADACGVLLAACRGHGVPVFFSRGGKHWHTSRAVAMSAAERGGWARKGALRDGPLGKAELAMEIAPGIAPRDGEVVVTKHRPSAFFGSPLAADLAGLGVDTLVVAGMMTSGCVRATVTDAFSHDLRVVVPRECVADKNAAAHEANLYDIDAKYADVVSLADVLATLHDRHRHQRSPTP